jgi:hypothetical protein
LIETGCIEWERAARIDLQRSSAGDGGSVGRRGTIVVFVLSAVVVGLVAAIFPARRASQLNILRALQYE